MNDQGRWQRMKRKFGELRVKYYKMKAKLAHELDAAGLRLSRRSKKIHQKSKHRQQQFIHEHMHSNSMYDDEYHMSEMELSEMNQSLPIEYEYDDFDAVDDDDEFEQVADITGTCDQIDWNAINNDSTVYILSTYLISDKIVCSLSDIELDFEYDHICEYGKHMSIDVHHYCNLCTI
jgi:hypothetical protein